MCTPSQKEEVNVDLRNFSGTELGINHQTKFMAYDSRKDLIDKFVVTEFFYKQDWLPGFSIKGMRKSLKLIRENKEFLYGDYVARLFKPVSISPLSVSERQRIRQLAENYCGEVGYEIKQGKNPYLNSIMNSIGGNLHRVKAILGRSSFKTNRNVESLYLQNLELNFEEIKDSKDYINLPDKKANMEKIRRIMNNVVRRNIITSLRERGRSAYEEEIINAVSVLCHDKKDILNEIYNLMRGGVIYKVNNILYLIDGDL